ncbi:two-component sensor histidine kinase [Streptomyces lunaelactis]|uniref:sensor histidine kinase n=1 Tax=Streptomyces lunaelactis TaxID=1535768 RepID=UPI0015853A3C|nr:histidine kinase [Streptomyces lunaelactis]NUK10304.1 two-component sensor histidine kinase [Streptomyces lunaelactis]NUK36970.1 two-component sensor histidine kinase [Streptomyces lunaelactis]NUK44827.1 two-component sensor histidine kinase [Streptomyces lunaelactis]NUK60184.1 two-component sensor histidine kinase [Streptomyces lunaelactis]NUK95391.1 two-component sensor histidine kinase [Streptomyces lunaelactis]
MPQRPFDLLAVVLVFGHCLPLMVRRRAPALSLMLVSCMFFAYQSLGYRPTFATIALYIAQFSAGVHQVRHRRATEAAWTAGYVALAVCLVALGSPSPPIEHVQFFALPAGCWLLGAWARTRLHDQALRQEREMESAMLEEREHIARELHDVVTHHVTAMVMQADATLYVPPGDRPKIEAALTAIGGTGRRALADLRDLLGVLSPGHDTETAPRIPTAGRFGELVVQTRLAGQPVEFVEDGQPYEISGIAELAAYRVLQEALTNALKHAPGRRTVVHISYAAPNRVTIEVTTEGSAAPPGRAHIPSGRGLTGLRQRVRLAGGELATRRGEDGGFLLLATLPTGADAA